MRDLGNHSDLIETIYELQSEIQEIKQLALSLVQ